MCAVVSVATRPGRPEDYATTSPYGRRMIWERKHPGLMIRPPCTRSPTEFGPNQGETRPGWDVARCDTGNRVAGPWATAEALLSAIEEDEQR
jgi:hypothetical protein